jgi:hypothetical protein
MLPERFVWLLDNAHLSQRSFATITGANPRTVQRWSEGSQDIPKWVGVVLVLLAKQYPPREAETKNTHAANVYRDLITNRAVEI